MLQNQKQLLILTSLEAQNTEKIKIIISYLHGYVSCRVIGVYCSSLRPVTSGMSFIALRVKKNYISSC